MGYECVYHYHERLEEGGYNKDETKTMKRKVGDAYDEVPLEKVASVVMAQLARRDIWVTNVEIFEYTKKPITFRETKGGIVIKNKKFAMDGENVTMQDIEVAPAPTSLTIVATNGQHPHNVAQNGQHPHNNQIVPSNNQLAPANRPAKPRRTVMFMPAQPGDIQELHKQGYIFTVEKRYPVYGESPHPRQIGVNILRTIDDNGRDANVSDVCFVPAETHLIADRELNFSKANGNMVPDEKLVWSNVMAEMPNLRQGKK
jgi:hypothetical protein